MPISPELEEARSLPSGEPKRDLFIPDRVLRLEQEVARNLAHHQVLYDSFTRPNNTDIGYAVSGQRWSEHDGNAEINSNGLQVVSGTAGKTVVSALLGPQDVLRASFNWRTGGAAGDIDTRFLFRMADLENHLAVQIIGGGTNEFVIYKRVAGSNTVLRNPSFTPSASTTYILTVEMWGDALLAKIWEDEAAATLFSTGASDPADTVDPFRGNQDIGIEFTHDAADRVGFVGYETIPSWKALSL